MAARKKSVKKTAKKAAKKAPPAGLNRAGLIELVQKEMGGSRASADRAVAAVLGSIQKGLKKSKKVSVVGFGTFAVKRRPARKGRNPQTGESIRIRASKSVGFKVGKTLKDSM